MTLNDDDIPFPVQGPALRSKLDDIVTPRLARFGIAWCGDYRWVQAGDTPIRRIAQFNLMKGAGGIMSWGYSLSFVPAIVGGRLAYHRSAQNARKDIFEFESSYVENVNGGPRYREVFREARQLDATLDRYLQEVIPQMQDWWDNVGDIERIERELEQQQRTRQFHHPSPTYVLSFVKAARGDREAAQRLFQLWLGAQARFDRALSRKLIRSLEGALDNCHPRYERDQIRS